MHLAKRVVCAAMLMKDGTIVTGVRHYSPEMRVILKKLYGEKYHLEVEKQGFVDQFGNFLSRGEAWKIARDQKQIIRPTGFEVVGDQVYIDELAPEGMLFSENLY